MGELKNITFNPVTGLFEDCTNPTAHQTQSEIRRLRRQLDPMAAQMKPIIRSVYLSGGARPEMGKTVELSWLVDNARRVVVTFPSGNIIEFPPASSCQFVVPRRKSYVRIMAYNGKFHTQKTITIKPSTSLFQRLWEWFVNN